MIPLQRNATVLFNNKYGYSQLGKAIVSGNIYIYILITLFTLPACAPQKKHNIIVSEDMLYGEWELVGKEQVNYPNIEFLKDSSAVLHSQADTIYRFTFSYEMTHLFLSILTATSM